MLVDYGTEWEEAWNDHVKAWKPDKNYVSPHDLNKIHDIPLLTHDRVREYIQILMGSIPTMRRMKSMKYIESEYGGLIRKIRMALK